MKQTFKMTKDQAIQNWILSFLSESAKKNHKEIFNFPIIFLKIVRCSWSWIWFSTIEISVKFFIEHEKRFDFRIKIAIKTCFYKNIL